MGRVLRTSVSTTRAQRKPQIPDLNSVKNRDERNKGRKKRDFDSHHGVRQLPPLQPGDHVWIPERESEAEVQGEVAPQSYQVVAGDGTFRTNRHDLIHLPSAEADEAADLTSLDPDATETDPEGTESDEQSNENSNENSNNPSTRPTESTKSNAQPAVRRGGRNSQPPERLDPSWSN